MHISDYLYYYGSEFLKYAVKETICLESWEGADYDSRYIEYIQMYLKCKNELAKKDDDSCVRSFKGLKETLIENFFKKINSRFFNSLEKKYGKLKHNDMMHMTKRLIEVKDENSLEEYIFELRKIEEDFLSKEGTLNGHSD